MRGREYTIQRPNKWRMGFFWINSGLWHSKDYTAREKQEKRAIHIQEAKNEQILDRKAWDRDKERKSVLYITGIRPWIRLE